MTTNFPTITEYKKWMQIQKQQKRRVLMSDVSDTTERKYLLKVLRSLIVDYEDEWYEAIQKDLGKSAIDTFTSEMAVILEEIDWMEKHLEKWQRPKKNYQLKLSAISQTYIEKHPHGSILIISPWNYPLNLSLMPAVGALAAGNSCFIKLSEFTPHTSQLLAELVDKLFPPEILTVVQGDEYIAEELLKLPWDFIFFTGSKETGKIIHEAAARKQIPVVLELGGKNPCIVHETNMTKATVRRIVWGKFLNNGQTCIAPDTVYIQESVYDKFLELIIEVIQEFYSENPKKNPSLGRIIHRKQFNKMKVFLKEGIIHYGGRFDEERLFLEPTVMTDVPKSSPLLKEEIFGPILPVVPYTELTSLVKSLQQADAPLVVYLFSKDKTAIAFVEQQLISGAFSVNQVIYQAVSSQLPFGGVGASGFGRYHGVASLETFSYQKSILKSLYNFNSEKQYPPYTSKDFSLLRKLRKWLF